MDSSTLVVAALYVALSNGTVPTPHQQIDVIQLKQEQAARDQRMKRLKQQDWKCSKSRASKPKPRKKHRVGQPFPKTKRKSR